MAKLNSTAAPRPSSRQGQSGAVPSATAPPAAAAATTGGGGRATRSTRSQSREPETAVEPPTPRRTRRQGSVENDAPAAKAAAGGRRRRKSGLDPVAEDAGGEEEEVEEVVAVDAIDAVGSPTTSAGRLSAISGTTAKTSFSQEEIQDLDKDIVLDNLVNLSVAAEDLALLLAPDAGVGLTWKDIKTDGTRLNKVYKSRLRNFDNYKEHYGSQEYLQPTVILRVLLGVTTMEEVPPAEWRPDYVIFQANLAQMLRSLITHFSDPVELTDDAYHALGRLDGAFPKLVAGGEPSLESFDASLSISIQHAIAQLTVCQSYPDFSANEIVRGVFYTDDGGLKHANSLGLDTFDGPQQVACQSRVMQAVQELEAPFQPGSGMSVPAAIGKLRSAYPRGQTTQQLVQYHRIQAAHYDEQLQSVGDVRTLHKLLSQEIERRDEVRLQELRRASFKSRTPKKRSGFKERPYLDLLRAREKRLSENNADGHSTAPIAQMTEEVLDPSLAENGEEPVQQDDGWTGNDGFQDIDELEDPPADSGSQPLPKAFVEQLSAFQTQQAHHAQVAQKSRGRSFLDRQDGAQRVSFEDTQQSQLAMVGQPQGFRIPGSSAPATTGSGASLGKRPRTDDDGEDFEPTQDGGFETAQVDFAAADRRRQQVPVPQQRFVNPPTSSLPGPSGTSDSAASSPSKRRRKNPGSALPPPVQALGPDDPLLDDGSWYARAKVQAKHGRIMASQNKPAQVRVPWTDQEEHVLIELIIEHGDGGISYAELKKLDDASGQQLERRTAEDFRFKARNMKVTMLLAGVDLPPNWDNVKLDKKGIDKITARGVHYYQDTTRVRAGDA